MAQKLDLLWRKENEWELNKGPLAQLAAKPIYWHQVVVKESTAFIVEPSKEDGQLMLKRPELHDGF